MAVRVVAPAVQVTVGARVYQVDMGGLLPDGTAPEDVERLVRKGLVVAEGPAEGPAEEFAPEPAEAPEPEKPQARKPAAK